MPFSQLQRRVDWSKRKGKINERLAVIEFLMKNETDETARLYMRSVHKNGTALLLRCVTLENKKVPKCVNSPFEEAYTNFLNKTKNLVNGTL